MRTRRELEIIKNFIDSTYSNFGNKLIVDVDKKYDPEVSSLGFCFKHIDPVTGGVVYKIDCSKIGIERTDFRIMMHEYAHIYLGHLDGIHEELDVLICNAFRDHRPEIIDTLITNCGISGEEANKLIERIIDDPQLNHEIHNIAMDMECNSSILSKEDIEEMELDITSTLPKFEEEFLEKAIKDANFEDYRDVLKDKLRELESTAKVKLMIPERYYLTDANGVKTPFPNDLSYSDYLILIVTHPDQFIKMLASIQMGENGDTKEISKEDVQNALSGMLNQMRQRSQGQSEAFKEGYKQALRDARSGKVDPSQMNQNQDPTSGKSEEYREGFNQGVSDTVKSQFGNEDFKQGFNDGYNDEMNNQTQNSQGQQNPNNQNQQDQGQSEQQGSESPEQGSQGCQGHNQSGQQSQDYKDGYEAGQRSAQMSQNPSDQQGSQSGSGQPDQNGDPQGQNDYKDGYNDGRQMTEDYMNSQGQQGSGSQGGQQPGQGQDQGQGSPSGSQNPMSPEMQDYNRGYQQALNDLANQQNSQSGDSGLSDFLQQMGMSSMGEGINEHDKADPGQTKGNGQEQDDTLNPYEGTKKNQDHCTDSRIEADKKREAGQIQAGGGVGMGHGNGPSVTREVDKFADDVDMALKEVLDDVHSKVVKTRIQRDMLKLYNRGIVRSVIAPALSRKVSISTKPKIVFLIDVSGSMDTRLIDRILKTISKSLKKINRDLRYDIITWSDCLGEHIKDIDPRKSIPRISCGGGTEMADGMKYFKEHYNSDAILVLISDFCDDLDSWHDVERTMRNYSMWGFNYGNNRYSCRRGDWDWSYFKQRDFSDYGYDN